MLGMVCFVICELGFCGVICNFVVFGFIFMDMIEGLLEKFVFGYFECILVKWLGLVDDVVVVV